MTSVKYTRRESERLKRVELILDAAERLFLDNGFTVTTMNEIAEAAEFGRATLYHYFPSKEAMYVAILDRAMDAFVAETREEVAKVGTAAGKIKKLKDLLLAFAQDRKNIFHLYFITRFEVLPNLDASLAERLKSKLRELDKVFYEIYKEGAENGEFQSGDPATLGDIFFAQIIGLMLFNSTEILEPDLTAMVNKATSFFLENIKSSHQ